LYRYLLTSSHLPEADTIYRHALQAAQDSGNIAAEASALNSLGGIAIIKDQLRNAIARFEPALEAYRRCGDPAGEARVLQLANQGHLTKLQEAPMAIGPDSVQIRNLDKQAARLRRLSEIINSTYAPCVSVSEVFPARLNQPGGWRGGWAGAAGARTAADWVVPG
jgi:hypothetical protein